MAPTILVEELLTHSVIGGFFEVDNTLGFGFLEEIYVRSLTKELRERGHSVAREVRVPVRYKGELIGFQRMDMIVDGKLVVETKSTYELQKNVPRQLYNYLRATGLEVGLLLHFGPKAKFHRMVANPPRNNPGNLASPVNPVKALPS